MDRLFHQALISGYSNQFIRKLIADIRIRIVIYESEFMESAPANTSSEQHKAIIEALENENLELAITLLKSNWQLSISHIMKTFQAEV